MKDIKPLPQGAQKTKAGFSQWKPYLVSHSKKDRKEMKANRRGEKEE
jgi:hypothetical protein